MLIQLHRLCKYYLTHVDLKHYISNIIDSIFNKRKEGICITMNGSILNANMYVNDLHNGSSKIYKYNDLVEESTYINHLKHGISTKYFTGADGNIKHISHYNYGYKHGVEQYILLPGGNVLEQRNFVNGLIDGVEIYYTIDGKLKELSNYRIGCLHGRRLYYENGILTDESYYDMGISGTSTKYYPNGSIKSKNVRERKEIFQKYSEQGVLLHEAYYNNHSEKHGIERKFNKLGHLISSCEYCGNRQYGERCEYFSNGQLRSRTTIYDYNIHEYERYYKNGRYIKQDLYGKKVYDNGRLICEGGLFYSDKHGEWLFYDSNGNIRRRKFYCLGDLVR